MSRKKLLLVQPSDKTINKGGQLNRPLTIAYVAALTPDHWDIEIVDEITQEINFDKRYDLVGITVYTPNAPRAYQLAEIFREKSVPVVLGGIHISIMPEEAMRYADSVVVGVAEPVWAQLLEDFENNNLKPRYDGVMTCLDDLPMPRRDLLPKSEGIEIMISSKGCPYNCEFCVTPKYYDRKFLHRPISEILREMNSIKEKVIFFGDDNLFGKNKYRDFSVELFRAMKENSSNKIWTTYASLDFAEDEELLKGAREAGCRLIYIGIETINPESLKQMRKGINYRLGKEGIVEAIKKFHKHGLAVAAGIMLGNDHDAEDHFEELLEFADYAEIDVIDLAILTPYPGTKLYERLDKEKRIEAKSYPEDWKNYNELNLVYKLHNKDKAQFLEGLTLFSSRLYSWRAIAKRVFRTFKYTRNVLISLACLAENINSRKVFPF